MPNVAFPCSLTLIVFCSHYFSVNWRRKIFAFDNMHAENGRENTIERESKALSNTINLSNARFMSFCLARATPNKDKLARKSIEVIFEQTAIVCMAIQIYRAYNS